MKKISKVVSSGVSDIFRVPKDLELTFKRGYSQGWQDAAKSPEVQLGKIALDQQRLAARLTEFEKLVLAPDENEAEAVRKMDDDTLLQLTLSGRHPLRQDAAETLIERVGAEQFARLIKSGFGGAR